MLKSFDVAFGECVEYREIRIALFVVERPERYE